MELKKSVSYEDFGAIGDGITDDTPAIRATHEYANEHDCPVVLNPGKKYYFPPIDEPITIKTDTDFSDAEIIIDDMNLKSDDPKIKVGLFNVRSKYPSLCFTEANSDIVRKINENGGLDRDSFKKLDLELGYKAMLKIENNNSRTFIRYGPNQNTGSVQKDVVLIDAEGNVDPSTPLHFSYERISAIYVYRADEPTMTIRGGVFHLRANQEPSSYKYFNRNINYQRCNLVIDGVTYRITDERTGKYEGQPYCSFFLTENCHNVLVQNCHIDAHRTYYAVGSGGSEVGMGSKSISAVNCNQITYKNCIQTNFFTDETKTAIASELWGIMSSNYSKNISFIDSTLSRFDAHCGIYNGTVKGCTIQGIRIVGAGTLTIEDCEFYAPNKANTFISTREDFGSFWNGKISVKNISFHTCGDWPVLLMTGHWYNHNFGYKTVMPDEFLIDNFRVDSDNEIQVINNGFIKELRNSVLDEVPKVKKDENGNEITVYEKNKNPMTPPKKLVIKNCDPSARFVFPDKNAEPFFANTEYVIE